MPPENHQSDAADAEHFDDDHTGYRLSSGENIGGTHTGNEDPENEDLSTDMEISEPPAEYIQRDRSEASLPKPVAGRDYRLYLPKHSGWVAVIKQSWEPEHCYARNPGEEWFHLLANGEIYVQRGAEKYCLTCALRHKILTRNRLFWEKGSQEPRDD